MPATKRVRIIKKIREASGLWRFISLDRIHNRYVWDRRPGYYFVEWWQGKKRCRQMASHTPCEATEAQRRKRNELIGELIAAGREIQKPDEGSATPTRITDAVETFLAHVRVHSPDKPKTHQRYRKVLEHFERVLGKKKYMEAITRADMDDYKIHRHVERSSGRIPWLLPRGHTVLEHVDDMIGDLLPEIPPSRLGRLADWHMV